MSDHIKYTFKIEGFTPDSLPFERLVDYYSEVKRMLGVSENMHLVAIAEGSHGSVFAIDRNHEKALVTRLLSIKEGSAPATATRAQNTINRMLKEDGTSGVFYDAQNRNVIEFPGRRDQDKVLVRIRDAASFTGELYHIAGTKDDAKIRISTDAYGVVFCNATRDLAKALRDFLFEEVRVSGRGTWTKNEDGKWAIDDFTITDFAPVKSENLRSAVDRIRAMDIGWPSDTLADIRSFEEKNGTAK